MNILAVNLQKAEAATRDLSDAVLLALGWSIDYDTAKLATLREQVDADEYGDVLDKMKWLAPADAEGKRAEVLGENRPDPAGDVNSALRMVPVGFYWMLGKGRIKPTEPLYGFVMFRDEDAEKAADGDTPPFAQGESDHAVALAISAALVLCAEKIKAGV